MCRYFYRVTRIRSFIYLFVRFEHESSRRSSIGGGSTKTNICDLVKCLFSHNLSSCHSRITAVAATSLPKITRTNERQQQQPRRHKFTSNPTRKDKQASKCTLFLRTNRRKKKSIFFTSIHTFIHNEHTI